MSQAARESFLKTVTNKENDIETLQTSKRITIFHIPVVWFFIFVAITLISMYTENLPGGMIGSLLVMIVLGELFGWAGDRLPIIKTYLGGGAIIAIFGSAYMVYSGLLPEAITTSINDFMKAGGFLDFYIAALITGSILGMNSRILVKVGLRYFLPIGGAVLGAIILTGVIGAMVGFTLQEAVLVIQCRLWVGEWVLGLFR